MRNLKNILVLGDWVVDDNWHTGVHRSSTSLRTGGTHFRSLHLPGAPIRAFCGAGRLASILHDARITGKEGPQIFAIHGLGVWHHDEKGGDTGFLEKMFDFKFRSGQSPYAFKSAMLGEGELTSSTANKTVNLYNLAEFLSQTKGYKAGDFTTTRTLRIFQQQEKNLSLLGRIDWELPPPPQNRDKQGAPQWLVDDDDQKKRLREFLNRLPPQVDAVIIKDLIKGVVTDTLVQAIAKKFPAAQWFVSTKRWMPSWLHILNGVNLKLYFIPPVAAQTALTHQEGSKSSHIIDSWIAPSKAKPTRGAMRRFAEIEKDLFSSKPEVEPPIVAVSPKEGSIIAKKGAHFIVHDGSIAEGSQLVGWATAFFSALCGAILRNSFPKGSKSVSKTSIASEPSGIAARIESVDLKEIADFSLSFASRWAEGEVKYLTQPGNNQPTRPEVLVLAQDMPNLSPACSGPFVWEDEWKAWTEATGTGTILFDKKPRIELWRGMTAVNGYICFDPNKRSQLRKLATAMQGFRRHIDRHEAVELNAKPGSGKSHLVRCLAEISQLRMLSFNISQMCRREDIISCFDTIVTTQASEKRRPLLVFFDELNVRIANQPVYDAFLSPLEEGVYVRGGLKFHIKPCVWVFAGTSKDAQKDPDSKYQDFNSRLTLGTIDIGELTSLERTYLGVQLARLRFPDVRRVSQEALSEFGKTKGDVRELRNIISQLRDVQDGQISKANFPKGEAESTDNFIEID